MNIQTGIVAINMKQSDIVMNKRPKDRSGGDVRIKKIVFIALAAAFVVSGATALTAAFLPYTAFAAGALLVFKVIGIITGIAIGIFVLAKALDLIAPKLPRPLALVANYIHASITEMFSLLAMSACYFVNLEKRNPKIVEGNNQKPILLIHGLYHNSSAWIEYIGQLKAAHVGPVFTINLGNPFGSIHSHAEKIKKMVAEIQRITGRKDIMLVGHSMGGVVASTFALDWATKDTLVTDIVTIASPLDGSSVAHYIGYGKSVRETRTGSDHITDLSDKICQQTKINFFHIASKTDQLVPAWSAALPKNKRAKHLIFPNLGHCALLYSKAVIDPIIDYYKNQ